MVLETILGGVTGLIGNVISSIMTYKTQKLKNQHEQMMMKLETAAMRAEAEANIRITKAQVEGAVELADSQAYMASIHAGNKAMLDEKWVDKLLSIEGRWKFITIPIACLVAILFGFVDWLRGFMRPALTMYLTILTTAITWMAWDIMQKHGMGMTSEQAVAVFNQVVAIVIYLTVSCVTWWFGDRRIAKFLTTLHEKKGSGGGASGGPTGGGPL